MQPRFVSWAAVSSLPQAKKVSVDDQLETNKEHIAQWGGLLVEEIAIRGKTRSIVTLEEARKYEEYEQLCRLIDQRAFDVLIYLDRSRLGRKANLIDTIVEKCHEVGIVTYATESPPATLELKGFDFGNRVLGAIESIIAQHEVVKIQHRHEMGMAARVRDGNFPARVPYGWTVDYIKIDGKPTQIVLVDEEAKAIIARIVELYVDRGLSFRSIVQTLQDEGLPPPKLQTWKVTTIDRILGLAWRYAGYVELNQRSKKKRQYIKEKSRWPALISEERAKQIVSERARRAPARRSVESPHLFSQIVYCEKCQRRMEARYQIRKKWSESTVKERTENYRCMTDGYPSHAKNQIAGFYITDAVRAAIHDIQSEENRQLLLVGQTDYRPRIEANIAKTMQRLEKHEEATQRADDAYVLGKMDYDRYGRQLERLENEQAQIQDELARLHAQLEEQQKEEGRAERLLTVANEGLRMLESEDVAAANAWFRRHIQIWIDNDNPRRRIRIDIL